ncbi:MAG: molecular chaperone DnaJ [Methanomassiliicoccales archaeon]|nr:molecular chaperone DnaJ [Methanomassiliicoccales archaeon]
MAEKRDYYAVLGVAKGSSPDDIKAAYRTLARKYHPDVTKEDKAEAEERFKEISEAYEVLVDPEKRKLYDQYGFAGLSGQFGQGGFQWSDFTHAQDVSDIFGDMGNFGFGGSLFDALFGGGRRRTGPHQGQSLRYDVEITLEEASKGESREVQIPHAVACEACHGTGAKGGKLTQCPTCGGKGQIQNVQQRGYSRFVSITPCPRCGGRGQLAEARCPECGGRGQQVRTQKLSVDIPPGIDDGMRLRVPGAGDVSSDGGPPGDLFVVVHVRQHEIFRREGADLWIELPVSFADAAMGAETEVPTIDGKATLHIPPGTQGNAIFRMKGNGLQKVGERGKGDQFVRVQIRVPKKLSTEQKALLKKFSELEGEKKGLLDRFKG